MALVVAFEGLPGAGKTTALSTLMNQMQSAGQRVETITLEASEHAETLRAIAYQYGPGHRARLLLLWFLRQQQNELLRAEEASGQWDVLFVDRSWGTPLAFDGYGHGVPAAVLDWVQEGSRHPDLTLFLDVPAAVAQARKGWSNTLTNPAFVARVVAGYRELAERFGWIQIDASQSREAVATQCGEALARFRA